MRSQGERSRSERPFRASDDREWQLWLLTLAFLMLFGIGAVLAIYLLLDITIEMTSLRRLAQRLLIGLAILIALYCLHVLQTRLAVSRIKLFLNEMNGMATGNLEFENCLAAIVRGFAAIYGTSLARLFMVREQDQALELVSTQGQGNAKVEPPDGYAHSINGLPRLLAIARDCRSRVIQARELCSASATPTERLLLTGNTREMGEVLIVPVRSEEKTVGLLTLARPGFLWSRRYHRREVETATNLALYAGRVIQEATRRRDAIQDPLTKLYNRRHFKKRIGEELKRAARENQTLAVLLCDLDRFKQVNDRRGHQVGDDTLRLAATALRSATRGTDLHFRWGGDEFVVVLLNTSVEGSVTAAQRIRNNLIRATKEKDLDTDMSIGIALYPQHGCREDELIRVADLAMYVAKKGGDKVHVGFETYMLDEQCVKLVFQPIHECHTGTLLAYEAFVRDPGGKLNPLQLFDRYRATGQLDSLKRLVIELQLAQAGKAGLRCIFVNVDVDFLHATEPIARPVGLEVVLELSDLGHDRASTKLPAVDKWRQAGYRVAIANFGGENSPLTLMERLQPDYLKIGRANLIRAVESAQYLHFLRHLLTAAASLTSARVVAEGIEDEAELQVAHRIGVSHVQGFLLGRPEELGAEAARRDAAVSANR